MAYRKKTLRIMSPVARKLARLIGEQESIARRLKNMLEQIKDLEADAEALKTAKGSKIRWEPAEVKRWTGTPGDIASESEALTTGRALNLLAHDHFCSPRLAREVCDVLEMPFNDKLVFMVLPGTQAVCHLDLAEEVARHYGVQEAATDIIGAAAKGKILVEAIRKRLQEMGKI